MDILVSDIKSKTISPKSVHCGLKKLGMKTVIKQRLPHLSQRIERGDEFGYQVLNLEV